MTKTAKDRAMNNTCAHYEWGGGFVVAPMLQAKFGEACSIQEYAFLFGLAALVRPERILEIGTSEGLGSISLALGGSMGGAPCEVVTIDKKEVNLEENLKLFPEISMQIKCIQGDSHEVLRELHRNCEKFDLCFLDGGHDYQTVSTDWQFAKRLSDKWLFHDSVAQPGVARLLKEIRDVKEYQIFDMLYPPGHQLDEPTGEMYQTLTSPGFCLVQIHP